MGMAAMSIYIENYILYQVPKEKPGCPLDGRHRAAMAASGTTGWGLSETARGLEAGWSLSVRMCWAGTMSEPTGGFCRTEKAVEGGLTALNDSQRYPTIPNDTERSQKLANEGRSDMKIARAHEERKPAGLTPAGFCSAWKGAVAGNRHVKRKSGAVDKTKGLNAKRRLPTLTNGFER
jgi:hypothetical protein